MNLLLSHSDFGIGHTVGARMLPIAKRLKKEGIKFKIYTRGYNKALKKEFKMHKIMPLGSLIMKALTAIPIYISKSISTDPLKIGLLDTFLKMRLKHIDFDKVETVHSWQFFAKTYKQIKKQNPKTMIIQDVAIAFPAVLNNLKDSELFQDRESMKLERYVKDAIPYVDMFIAPSEFVKRSLMMEGIPEKKIAVIPFGVDVRRFNPADNPAERDRKFRVAFVGNINKRKGINHLIDAWKQLALKNAELNLYGRVYPEVAQNLKDAKKYGINTPGFVDSAKELPKNDIYVFPSLMEGSSKSIYEAMASGLPIITTFNSGSVVRDGVEGFIIPICDVDALKEKIKHFYDNRDKIKEFGTRARKRALEFTWEDYSGKVLAEYKKPLPREAHR